MASKVAELASPDGTAYRRNYSALVALVEAGWDVPTLKARHAVTALVDTSPATKDVTDLDSAVTFAADNAKSDDLQRVSAQDRASLRHARRPVLSL